MAAEKELSYAEIAEHKDAKDLYVVIHDKVYSVASFLSEHPGGEEVLLDVGGQDATEAFEDVGHSDEAREILEKLQVGKLKRSSADLKPNVGSAATKATTGASATKSSSSALGPVLAVLAALIAFGAFKYYQTLQQ